MKDKKVVLQGLLCCVLVVGLALPAGPAGAWPTGAQVTDEPWISGSEIAGSTSTSTIYVPDDFPTIQAAVDAAGAGDTIIVRDGIYTENVGVTMNHLTITSENGAETTIVQAANPAAPVFAVTADYVNVNGFTVKGTGGLLKGGLHLDNVEHCSISNNVASDNEIGIYSSHSSSNLLTGNIVSNNSQGGIYLVVSPGNILTSNMVTNSGDGIYVFKSSYTDMADNIVENSPQGIYILESSDTTLTNNTVSDNIYNFGVGGNELSHFTHDIDTSNKVNGKSIQYLVNEHDSVIDSTWDVGYLAIVDCSNITVTDLTLSNNFQGVLVAHSSDSRIENVSAFGHSVGIALVHSSSNTLANNTLQNTFRGVLLKSSSDNFMTGNALSGGLTSVGVYSSSNNAIYLNNFSSVLENVVSSDSANIWSSPEEMTYLYNGNAYTNHLGNYWSDYTGSDADGDGIGEPPYAIGTDADSYPLMEPLENYVIGEMLPPTEVWDWHDLDAIRDNLGGSYVLMTDLDSTTAGYEELAGPTANAGMGWQPIGTRADPLLGTVDGQGYSIRDLFIHRPDESGVGLFSDVGEGGVIKDLCIANAAVAGHYRVGSLAGENNGTVINACSSGSVAGTSTVGGLVGLNWEGTVSGSYSTASVGASVGGGGLVGSNYGTVNDSHASGTVAGGWGASGGLVGSSSGSVTTSYATGAVTGGIVGGLVGSNQGTVSNSYSSGSASALGETDDDWYAGGLAGWNSGTVTDSSSTSNVTGDHAVGGLVGMNCGVVTLSQATGSVIGKDYVGGLVGWNLGEMDFYATVSHSYSTGSVTGDSCVGGLAGLNQGDATVSYSYSTGVVSGSSWVGGLLGHNHAGDVANSFWDVQTSGRSASAGGTGKTTAEMMDIRTFNDPGWSDGLEEPWDITGVPREDDRDTCYIWSIVDGQTYPFLSWEVPAAVTLVFNYPLSVPWTDTLGFGQSWSTYYGHLGEDYGIVDGVGTPIHAIASGEVILRHDYPGVSPDWGNALIIRHDMPNGETVYSQYAHLESMLVDEGEEVELGEQIGTMGKTGFATGPHLHLEIKDAPNFEELAPNFRLGYGYANKGFTQDVYVDERVGVTYYRPSTFIEQYRGLKAGDELAVAGTGGVGLRLRNSPAIRSDNIITVMLEGSKVTIIDGPTIAHGYGWWHVQFGALQGWAAGRYLASTEGQVEPYAPTGLGQNTVDGLPVSAGGEVGQDTIVLRGTVSHPYGGSVRLQVELRPAEAEFQGRLTRQSGLVNSGEEAIIAICELSDGDYHWQARAVGASGLTSEWVGFGDNAKPGFSIKINRSPVALFDYKPIAPVVDEEIHFDASASYDWDEAIVSYEWDFGEGQIAFGEQVTHSYPETGDQIVSLTVTDAAGLQGEHTLEVRVFSKVLLDEIDRLIDTAIDDLDGIESVARDLAEATDYFAEEVTGAPREMAVSGALSIISFAAGLVVPDIDLGSLGKIPAPASTGAGADAVELVSDLVLGRLGEGEGFNTFFISNLEARIEEHRVELENLRVELMEDLPDISEEEVELFVSDLRGRRLGNLFMQQQYWTKAHTVLTYRQLKQDDEGSWTWIAGKNLWSWSLRLLDIAGSIATGGGLGAILVSGGLAIPEVSRGMLVALDQLDTDAQMMSMSMAALTDGFVQADRIFENVGKGLENIREETLPIPVTGEIVSIENVVEGHGGVFGFIRDLFSARKAYSEVRIENKGDAPATYDLYATSYRTFSTVGLIPGLIERSYEIPFVWHIQEEIGEGLLPETVTLAFLGEGGGQVPSGEVSVMLIGSSDDGVYGLDYRSTSFDTTYIDEDGEIIPQERARELRVRHYPVMSGVQYMPKNDSFVLTLHVSNEFETPLTADLYQQIPEAVEVLSADGGTVGPDGVRWELQLEAGATRVLEVALAGITDSPLEVPAAQYQMYDIINDDWLGFESDTQLLELPAVPEIAGTVWEVDCGRPPLEGVAVVLYDGDEVEVDGTVSDGDGNYTLAVPELGEYTVVASKDGFRQETQAITVSEATAYTLDFIGDQGLIPNDPDVFYVLDCIIRWKYPALPCELDVFRVLDVIIAWKYPILDD